MKYEFRRCGQVIQVSVHHQPIAQFQWEFAAARRAFSAMAKHIAESNDMTITDGDKGKRVTMVLDADACEQPMLVYEGGYAHTLDIYPEHVHV